MNGSAKTRIKIKMIACGFCCVIMTASTAFETQQTTMKELYFS